MKASVISPPDHKILPYNLSTPAYNASGRQIFHPILCEASSVAEENKEQDTIDIFYTTLL